MGQFDSELTRQYLLNSQSRGSLEEVISIDADQQMEDQEQLNNVYRPWLDQDEPSNGSKEGKELTEQFFRQYYE
ncbi:hypothetical protein [Paenibacillus fonticola]|uniref:hypothetical protein n=1 Tax=Paenibacillus fonticola TaxID=379896 RepID=UPI0003815DE0|nr:hypothetical protein [Paenibacillus fonticola]